jgi:hypothetical protein
MARLRQRLSDAAGAFADVSVQIGGYLDRTDSGNKHTSANPKSWALF